MTGIGPQVPGRRPMTKLGPLDAPLEAQRRSRLIVPRLGNPIPAKKLFKLHTMIQLNAGHPDHQTMPRMATESRDGRAERHERPTACKSDSTTSSSVPLRLYMYQRWRPGATGNRGPQPPFSRHAEWAAWATWDGGSGRIPYR